MMPMRSILVAATLLLATAGDGRAQAVTAVPAAAPASDVLRPGDIVRLRIWREEDLSGDYLVDPQGVVIFPKIGWIETSGRPSGELRDEILEAYRQYLRNPSIEIIFLRRVNILGAVRDPGLYPIDPTMAIADVLALAGGTQPWGKPDEVQLIRGGEIVTTHITQRTRVAELEIHSSDQIYVPERSWLSRNTGIVATAISSAVSLVIAVIYVTSN